MTAAAMEFIQPLTFAALTGKKVITSLFSRDSAADTLSSAVEHIGVAQEHDVLVVAPATADILSKFAHGAADDFLSTVHLAFTGKVILAPAMNTVMWNHAAVQENLKILASRGYAFVDPEEGWLACGTVGAGRLADPERIAEFLDSINNKRRDLAGETVLVTAGPTQEAIDPVRFISNRSSGKMGYAIANAAAQRGASVVLVSGPVAIPPPANVELVSVHTAEEMRAAVMQHLGAATIVIKNAAVADYHVSDIPKQKLKKTATRLSLELDPTPDILAELGQKKGDRLLIGFAAETDNLLDEARRKMTTKNCDMLVANQVNREGVGFEADRNEVDIVTRDGRVIHAGPADKSEIAERILDQVATLRLHLHASTPA
jgi:phosphopantothenoylcysteine decarboxylase/phosphopantothenate--cysteine ligase